MAGYPQILKYFMWPWQVYFRISSQTGAESLFNQLDTDLQPNIFLIGFLLEKQENRLPICIEPENLGYSLDEFEDIQKVADELFETSEDRNMYYSGEGMQEEMNNRFKKKSYRLAIEKTLNESKNNLNTICFVSSAVFVEGYQVFVILELNRSVYESHFHLSKVDPEENMKIYYSLLETAKDAYLKDRTFNLNLPDPGKNLSSNSKLSEELLREAARSFMYTISWAGKNGHGIHGLFDTCNKISTFRYEGIESKGHLIIAEKNHDAIEMTLELETPFNIHNHRKSRKFLQLSNDDVAVICDSYNVLGLGRIKPSYDSSTESIFNIRFNGVHCWDVFHNKTALFQMRYGLPQFPQEVINKEKFINDANRIFANISTHQIENLYNLSIAVTKQKKGAMLVISENAQAEAIRLNKQCINIKPIQLNSELLLNLTSIDGGVILDICGVGFAQGVILDGIVGYNGDSARGSRFNSAVTYQEHKGLEFPTMIIVVSEDGMVDVIPTLKPQIKQSEILNIITLLEKLSSESAFDRSTFYNTMEWLKNRQFYLTKEDCEKINSLKRKLEKLDKNTSGQSMWIIHEDFFPNPLMNKSYYLSENKNMELST